MQCRCDLGTGFQKLHTAVDEIAEIKVAVIGHQRLINTVAARNLRGFGRLKAGFIDGFLVLLELFPRTRLEIRRSQRRLRLHRLT